MILYYALALIIDQSTFIKIKKIMLGRKQSLLRYLYKDTPKK